MTSRNDDYALLMHIMQTTRLDPARMQQLQRAAAEAAVRRYEMQQARLRWRDRLLMVAYYAAVIGVGVVFFVRLTGGGW